MDNLRSAILIKQNAEELNFKNKIYKYYFKYWKENKREPDDYLITVEIDNFWKSDRYSCYGITESVESNLRKATCGDRLWFVSKKKSGGIIIAVSIFDKLIERDYRLKGLVGFSNTDFGWIEGGWISNHLLIYKNRINLELLKIIPELPGQANCRNLKTAVATVKKLKELGINLNKIYIDIYT